MNIQEQAQQDVRTHKYHNLIPGQKSPLDFKNSTIIWRDIYRDYAVELNTGLKQRQYRAAWLDAYQIEWDAYWKLGD